MATYKGIELVVEALDSEHRGYFEEIKKGHLVVQRCESCKMLRGSIGAGCPFLFLTRMDLAARQRQGHDLQL